MKYKVGLIEFTPGKYPGVLVIDDNGEGVFDAHNEHATAVTRPTTMGDLVDAGHLAEFRTRPVLAKDNPEYQRITGLIREGELARTNNASCPYDGQSVEHALHATGWVSRDLRLALDETLEELKAVREELEAVRQSNIYIRQKEAEYVRNITACREQRDQARSVLDYIFGGNSGQTDWAGIVERELMPPLPLEKHLIVHGLVRRHTYIEVRDELAKVQQHNQKLADNNVLLVKERNRARETNSAYAYQLKIAQDESERLYNALIISRQWVEYHAVAQGIAAEALKEISGIVSSEARPKQKAPPPMPPWSTPAHMAPVNPAPLAVYPIPQAGRPAPGIIGDNDGPWSS